MRSPLVIFLLGWLASLIFPPQSLLSMVKGGGGKKAPAPGA